MESDDGLSKGHVLSGMQNIPEERTEQFPGTVLYGTGTDTESRCNRCLSPTVRVISHGDSIYFCKLSPSSSKGNISLKKTLQLCDESPLPFEPLHEIALIE